MKQICFAACLLISVIGAAQDTAGYWQQKVDYNIDVQLDDRRKSLSGRVTMNYVNNSPDTLEYLWIHLWPNAYKNENTALAAQVKAGKKKVRKSEADRGFIDSLAFSDGTNSLQFEFEGTNIDVAKLSLAAPLYPGSTVTITTPFFVKLPFYYSRSGYEGNQFMVCQWYPKPAVYDRKGWHPMPYLEHGEFYSEFGRYDVSISLPASYVVAATGSLQNKQELAQYKEIGKVNNNNPEQQQKFNGANGTKTLRYLAENVHDFAWFADKDFIIRYDTLATDAGVVDVFSYSQPSRKSQWANSVQFIEDAVRHYQSSLGQYPYPVVAAVEGPGNSTSGGMEYPMVTLITSPDATRESLDGVITHEVGHNWLYGIIASNERDHAWMDEGINTFYQFRYEAEKYRYNSVVGKYIPKEFKDLSTEEFLSRIYKALTSLPGKQPIETTSAAFTDRDQYGIVVYIKSSIWMYILQLEMGEEALNKAMQLYFQRWKFRHPYPEDFRQVLEESSGKDLKPVFDLLHVENNFGGKG
jgi:hypothetical protein